MKTILITGARGFIGRNLASHLRHRDDVRLLEYDLDGTEADLRRGAAEADVVFHLAGVNRPQDPAEFEAGNAGFTARSLSPPRASWDRAPQLIVSSSVQADPGQSLRRQQAARRGGSGRVRPRHRGRRGHLPAEERLREMVPAELQLGRRHVLPQHRPRSADPDQRPRPELELAYVDDVVAAFLKEIDEPSRPEGSLVSPDAIPSYSLTLGDLAGQDPILPRDAVVTPRARFLRPVQSAALRDLPSYVEPERWEYGLDIKSDTRGNLAEFIKSPWFGQVFVSRTRPGITRGNHYHHTKTEKFFVIAGEGLIRFRHIEGTEILEYRVRGEDYRVVDIPPGYTHSITNVGTTELITLFWASEIFDPDRPDTYFLPVDLREAP